MSKDTVAILFARSDSIYKKMPGCDVWDIDRNAMLYAGNDPVVAHPPCRLWGKLSHMSSAPKSEMECARFAVRTVQRVGGVLEHPEGSRLWKDMGLPQPWEEDATGCTVKVPQYLWGHPAVKMTLLYISGIRLKKVPKLSMLCWVFNAPTGVVASKSGKLKAIPHADREHTPPEFAKWLVSLARRCRKFPLAPPKVPIP